MEGKKKKYVYIKNSNTYVREMMTEVSSGKRGLGRFSRRGFLPFAKPFWYAAVNGWQLT
jgi:hypothetical protein